MIPFQHHRSGRSRASLITLAAIYAALLLLIRLIDLSPVIAGTLAVFTLPALWEIATNPQAGLTLTQHTLSWHSAGRSDELPLLMLKSVRFDTRLDLSVRITLRLTDGRRIRLPHAATPPHRAFETALKSLRIPTERHHFALMG